MNKSLYKDLYQLGHYFVPQLKLYIFPAMRRRTYFLVVCNYGPFLFTLKAPITTAADDIHKYIFIVFQRNKT